MEKWNVLDVETEELNNRNWEDIKEFWKRHNEEVQTSNIALVSTYGSLTNAAFSTNKTTIILTFMIFAGVLAVGFLIASKVEKKFAKKNNYKKVDIENSY